MGRYASVDWIQFEWDEQRTGLGPVRTSLEQTASWYHQLGPWLDPGPEPGVSLCRLLVDGRVVVLSRTRTGGADSRRTIRVQAYLGGAASQPMAMPNVRQTLALASGWGSRLPGDDEPLDLGKLISSYESARTALDRESRAAAVTLAPIVSECLRRPGSPLSVASGGNAIVQLWGLVDILDLVLGRHPETFSTYESDDFNPGAEIVFLRKWPGVSSQSSNRTRVDPRSPGQGDRYSEIASMLVDAYARDQLVGLVKRLRISDRTPFEERLRRFGGVTGDREDELVWSPQPPARSQPAPSPQAAPSPAAPPQAAPSQVTAPHAAGQAAGWAPEQAAGQAAAGPVAGWAAEQATGQAAGHAAGQASGQAAGQTAQAATQGAGPVAGEVAEQGAGQTAQVQRPRTAGPAVPQYTEQDAFEMLCTDLTQATSPKDVTAILQEMRALAARRQPAEVRARLPRLIPVLERQLPEAQINPVLRALLDPDAPARAPRPNWLDPQWLVIVALLTVLVILAIVAVFLLA
ncbi:hypothetical protein GCM10009850_104480 [Nonomuraea monospora]|uniref:Uncharacterized protein n=1 Tax=Nonomuraea monospora TaxID=568818 RepID=A0ABP5PTE7_9ACTN